MDADAPLFLVGAPRSGTTLLAGMIETHPDITCGPETQFFNKISGRDLSEALADPHWPDRAVRQIARLRLAGQPVIELYGTSAGEVRAFLSQEAPSTSAMLRALTEVRARTLGVPRWAEKTPNHLVHLPDIWRTFPRARVVLITRDPRDVARSMLGLPWASRSELGNAWLWRDWHQRAAESLASINQRPLIVRYEDLLREPANTVALVCDHAGLSFDERMLSPERSATAVATSAETWKAKNFSALDPSRAYAWRRSPDPVHQVIGDLCHKESLAFGYLTEAPATRALPTHGLNFRMAGRLHADLMHAHRASVRLIDVETTAPGPVGLPSWGLAMAERHTTSLRGLAHDRRVRRRRSLATFRVSPGLSLDESWLSPIEQRP